MIAILLAIAIDCSKYVKYKPPAISGGASSRELAERYANGTGVKRDFDAAAYFLCRAEEDMAPAEFSGMLDHLARMRSGEEKAPLDFCDYVTSGYGMSYCAHQQYEKVMPELDRRIDAARARTAAKTQFDALRRRGLAYVRAESERIGAQSRGGTAHGAMSLGAEMEQKERFVENLERWSKQRASAADARRADDELNAAYRALMQETDAELKPFLRDAQRAWIAYRDAFAAYYVERWRGAAAPEALRLEIVTRLTRDRTTELRDNA